MSPFFMPDTSRACAPARRLAKLPPLSPHKAGHHASFTVLDRPDCRCGMVLAQVQAPRGHTPQPRRTGHYTNGALCPLWCAPASGPGAEPVATVVLQPGTSGTRPRPPGPLTAATRAQARSHSRHARLEPLPAREAVAFPSPCQLRTHSDNPHNWRQNNRRPSPCARLPTGLDFISRLQHERCRPLFTPGGRRPPP